MIIDAPQLACNAPIGWLGGKTRLSSTIVACMPLHICFVDVFFGSGIIFFSKPPKLSRIEIINDIHGELVNLMKVISGTYFDESIREEFIGYVRNMPAAREVYEDWKNWNQDRLKSLNVSQRAFRFYYCVKKGFSSVPKGGYEASPKTNSRLNMNTDFEPFAERFRARNAQIECLDFVDLIEKYNRPGDTGKKVGTFAFLDPPYFVANDTNYYDHVFTMEDHLRLRKICDDIETNKNKFLITYDDVPDVISLYKDFFIYRTDEIIYNAADERDERTIKKTELFITNYNIAQTIRLEKDIFDDNKVLDSRIEIRNHIGLTRIN